MSWTEKQFEEKMRPYIDGKYRGIFSQLKDIKRVDRNQEKSAKLLFMDIELAIDTHLKFNPGMNLNLQEKSRTYFNKNYQDFTLEYYNDPIEKIEGEFFKLAAQLYFYGYAGCKAGKINCQYRKCEQCNYLDDYCQYWILDVTKLMLFLKNEIGIEVLEQKYLRQNKPPAKANFFAIPFRIMPNSLFLVRNNKINYNYKLELQNKNHLELI